MQLLESYVAARAQPLLANQPPPEPQPIKPSPSKLFKFKPLLDSDVYMTLKTINPSKATGADNIRSNPDWIKTRSEKCSRLTNHYGWEATETV